MSHFLRLFEGETASTARQDPGALLSYLLKVHTRQFELGTTGWPKKSGPDSF